MNTTERLKQLLDSKDWSLEDRHWIQEYLATTDHAELQSLLEEKFKADSLLSVNNPAATRLLKKIHEELTRPEKHNQPLYPYIVGKRWLIAASILLIITTGSFLLLFNRDNKQPKAISHQADATGKNIVPGRDYATLTLSDGTTIILDSAGNNLLPAENNVRITKSGNQVVYSPEVSATQPAYHTMSTARGNQYKLQLADGSRVWLNAASSIRYPTTFVGTERSVEVTGEAYFEIAHNSLMPFKVVLTDPAGGKSEVEVLGTSFNIMSYGDEAAAQITLLEGRVKINSPSKTTLLQPGQQAHLQEGNPEVSNNVDVEEVVAWKNGYFQFNSASLEQLMRQISRWYDVEISYQGKIPVRSFGGKISRNTHIEEVIKILEASKIKCRTEGKKIIVAQ